MARRASRLHLLLLVALLPVYFLTAGLTQRLLFYGYGTSSVLAILVGLRWHRPERRGPWLAFAAGLALFVLGDVAFDLYALGHSVPVPSVADVLYLAAYPVLAWAMVRLVRHRVPGGDLASALDGCMVALGVGVVAWGLVMAPYAHDHTLTLAGQVVPIAYPALDLLLVASLARLLLSGGGRDAAFRMLAASTVLLLVADGFYGMATANGTYVNGSVIDLGWLLSYALWGAAALHPSMTRLTDPTPSRPTQRSRLALALLGLAAVAAPVTLVVGDLGGKPSDAAFLGLTTIAMFALVLARVRILTRQLESSNRRLARAGARQLVLTDAAVALVGTDDGVVVAGAAARAAVALAAGTASWACFVVLSPSGPEIVAEAGPVEPDAVDSLGPFPDRPVVVPAGAGLRVVAPVFVDGRPRATLVAGGFDAGPDDVLPDIALLCSQIGFALATVEATQERLNTRSERLFRSVVQNSTDAVTLVTADGLLHYGSPALESMLGRPLGDLVGRPISELIHAEDLPHVRLEFAAVVAGGLGTSASLEFRVTHGGGSWRIADAVLTNLLHDPDVGAVVLNTRDITVRRAMEEQLNRQAFADGLTGLANRALFVDRVGHALSRAEREAEAVAVLLLDLDDFKVINDSLGHPAGDALLVAVAERLRSATRPDDTVARLGGDEFAILLEAGHMPAAAEVVSGRIAEVMRAPFAIGGDEVTISFSIGITLGDTGTRCADDFLRDVDLAMYMAKRNGKHRHELFHPAMREEAIRRLEVAAELRRAIEGDQLEVFYQPIVHAASGTMAGAEALVRWRHPSRGLVPPGEFIPIAESTGLIVPLGRQVLQQACLDAAGWRASGVAPEDFYVSVNLSARQLLDPSLLDDVGRSLDAAALPASALVLEVTESALIDDLDAGLECLWSLKELGLRLAVDDFGTGYSSLSYLRTLPVDVVKVDKSFVDRVTLDDEGVAMVRSVVDLARALGLTSVAEGVEEEDQLAVLRSLGCDSIQGYLFARPVPAAEMPGAFSRLRAPAPSGGPAIPVTGGPNGLSVVS